ncbi:WD repeat-containing protein on Y chromosome [Blattella germanica]|nr:WD repeat-containing protein on Y chromosome [Blattella germanica]
MTVENFKHALYEVGGIQLDDEELEVLFMKMDTNRNGFLEWDEIVSHILLEFQEKEAATLQQSLTLPLEGFPKITRTNHRHPLVRITFCPAVQPDRSINYLHGKYITVSHDGAINYWNLDMEFERSVRSSSVQLKVQTTWVTDLVCLPDVNIVCTSSTDRELRFYDTTAGKFELRVLSG